MNFVTKSVLQCLYKAHCSILRVLCNPMPFHVIINEFVLVRTALTKGRRYFLSDYWYYIFSIISGLLLFSFFLLFVILKKDLKKKMLQ
jgi:hypothetical protein